LPAKESSPPRLPRADTVTAPNAARRVTIVAGTKLTDAWGLSRAGQTARL